MNLMVFNKKNKEILHIGIKNLVVICYEMNICSYKSKLYFVGSQANRESVLYHNSYLKYFLLHRQNVSGQPSKE